MTKTYKVGRFCLPIKPANKNLSCVMQKSGHFIGQIFTIGWQVLFMLP